MITFDFQQNLPTPNLHHSEVFYMRQMWMYNMGIHDFVGHQGPTVHVWRGCPGDEVVAHVQRSGMYAINT